MAKKRTLLAGYGKYHQHLDATAERISKNPTAENIKAAADIREEVATSLRARRRSIGLHGLL